MRLGAAALAAVVATGAIAVAAVSTNGVLGDPTGATAAEGRLLLDDLVARSVSTVRALLNP